MRRVPTLDVPPIYIARGVAAAGLAGLLTGVVWGFLSGPRSFLGFFIIFVAMGMGYLISEAISLATNRKRGRALQACAVGAVVLAYLVRNLVIGLPLLPQGDLWGILAAGFAAYYAAQRLNY